MALCDQALTTVATLRQWLTQNQTDETDGRLADTPLENLLNRASNSIGSYCDRLLIAPAEAQDYVFNGHGGRRIILREWPIAELTCVSVDGQEIPERPSLEAIGYIARPAEAWLDLVGYSFTRGIGNVTITGRLGYDATLAATDARHKRALDDLEQACLLLARFWWEKPAAGRFTLTAGDVAEKYETSQWPSEVRGLLAGYRRLGA